MRGLMRTLMTLEPLPQSAPWPATVCAAAAGAVMWAALIWVGYLVLGLVF